MTSPCTSTRCSRTASTRSPTSKQVSGGRSAVPASAPPRPRPRPPLFWSPRRRPAASPPRPAPHTPHPKTDASSKRADSPPETAPVIFRSTLNVSFDGEEKPPRQSSRSPPRPAHLAQLTASRRTPPPEPGPRFALFCYIAKLFRGRERIRLDSVHRSYSGFRLCHVNLRRIEGWALRVYRVPYLCTFSIVQNRFVQICIHFFRDVRRLFCMRCENENNVSKNLFESNFDNYLIRAKFNAEKLIEFVTRTSSPMFSFRLCQY